MKLPALAMAVSFAAGIALGLWGPFSQTASSLPWLRAEVVLGALLLAAALVLLRLRKLVVSALLSICVWVSLGFFGANLAQQPPNENFVLRAVQERQIDLHAPLRWQVQLRDEPERFPWGWRYDLDLRAVELGGATIPLNGGLRLSYSPRADDAPLPELHAGDSFWVLTQAKLPQVYRDAGAFDRRAYLGQQNIQLVATLRASELIEDITRAKPTLNTRLARIRRTLREELDALFASTPEEAGVLRAMLLGDRSFVDRAEAADFQKTGVFHVLVVAGLHVAAFATFLYWIGRRLRISVVWTSFLTLALLISYVAVIEQRPPVLRAALMAAVVLVGGCFFRKLDLLNSAAVAALIFLAANPWELRDSSFQLSFLAIGCIAAFGAPWLDRTVQPYAKALRGWRDVTRDAAHPPKIAQFRIDLRAFATWLSDRLPRSMSPLIGGGLVRGLGFTFRFWELFLLTLVLQIGMLPLLASDFHRVSLTGPMVNLIAVPLTGLIVPLGFLTLLCVLVWHLLGVIAAIPLRLLTEVLVHSVRWFAHFPRWSYRIPGPFLWVTLLFFAGAVLLAAGLRYDTLWWRRIGLAALAELLVVAALIATFPFPPRWTRGALELDALDVGQGDSLFLISPRGHTLLIDGGGAFTGFAGREAHSGPDPGEDAVSPYLWSRGFQRLDTVALTHGHQDHAGGLLAVLENFKVGTLWIGREVSSPVMARLEAEAHARHIQVVRENRGAPFSWDGVELQFLWPEASPGEIASSASNDSSLVLHLRYGSRSMLLPGDAEKQSEAQILAENDAGALRSDILKVGHHGSKNSTTPEFLTEVQPEVGIISAGEDNPYGHPDPQLLARLEEAHVWILRTDRNGAIRVLTDGRNLRISCFVACPDALTGNQSVERPSPEQQ